MRPTPLYQPDGMTSAGGSFDRFTFVAVQAHERHDDGLVHNHNWAASSDVAAVETFGETRFQTFAGWTTADRFDNHGDAHHDDRYDDGLVHNHDWAVTGK